MKKRLYRALVALAMVSVLFGVSACGNQQPSAESSAETEETTTEPETESEEETQKETETEEKETAESKESIEDKKDNTSAETSETKTTDEAKTSKTADETKPSETPKPSEATKPTETPKQTEAPKPTHEHNYSSTVTQNPSCTSNGVKTYTCSCGDSYTEAIPATAHNWVTQYKEVYHESQGQMQQVQVGTSDGYVACGYCGATFATPAECAQHRADSDDFNHAMSNSLLYPGEPIYEEQWVVTQEAYTEQVPYSVCSICGAAQ